MDVLALRPLPETGEKEKGIMLLDIAPEDSGVTRPSIPILRQPLHVGSNCESMADQLLGKAVPGDTDPGIVRIGKRRGGSQKGKIVWKAGVGNAPIVQKASSRKSVKEWKDRVPRDLPEALVFHDKDDHMVGLGPRSGESLSKIGT
jgi:hypothetical protein